MKIEHLSKEEIVDAVEGRGSASAREHASSCPECRTQVDEISALLGSVAEAAVPEPPPLYWEALRLNVRQRIETESVRSKRTALVLWPSVAAAAVLALALLRPGLHSPGAGAKAPTAPTLPSWSSLPVAEEDVGLLVLEGFKEEAGEHAADLACRSWVECIVGLSDDEASQFNEDLRAELKG